MVNKTLEVTYGDLYDSVTGETGLCILDCYMHNDIPDKIFFLDKDHENFTHFHGKAVIGETHKPTPIPSLPIQEDYNLKIHPYEKMEEILLHYNLFNEESSKGLLLEEGNQDFLKAFNKHIDQFFKHKFISIDLEIDQERGTTFSGVLKSKCSSKSYYFYYNSDWGVINEDR